MAKAADVAGAKNPDDFEKWEAEQPEDSLRTMGRKQFIPYGLYEARGFISANLAMETGFDDKDLKILFEAILNMYEHDRSASKGEMAVVSPLVIFRHTGTDSDLNQRKRQARLGCAPSHKLFDLVHLEKKTEYPRCLGDYTSVIRLENRPTGVDIGFLCSPWGEIVWNQVPEDAELFR